MRQGEHRFHATNGVALILDARGGWVRGANDLARQARHRIRGLMAAMPPDRDWSDWMMDVHDARGRHVVFVDFVTEGEVQPWEICRGYEDELSGPAVRAEAQAPVPEPPGASADRERGAQAG